MALNHSWIYCALPICLCIMRLKLASFSASLLSCPKRFCNTSEVNIYQSIVLRFGLRDYILIKCLPFLSLLRITSPHICCPKIIPFCAGVQSTVGQPILFANMPIWLARVNTWLVILLAQLGRNSFLCLQLLVLFQSCTVAFFSRTCFKILRFGRICHK